MYVLYLYTEDPALRALYAERQNTSDAGVDLYVPQGARISGTVFLSHQVYCRMTRNGEDVSYYLYPRSSMAKTRLRLANSVGIIDSGYRGEIISALDVVGDTLYEITTHQRLVQLCSPTLEPIRLILVDSMEDLGITERGAGGFGSTGK